MEAQFVLLGDQTGQGCVLVTVTRGGPSTLDLHPHPSLPPPESEVSLPQNEDQCRPGV